MKHKLIRITTVPMALRYLLPGQIQFMQQNEFDVLMVSANGPELTDVVTNEKCRHIVVPMTRKITPLQDLQCLFKLIKIFRQEKPDIVHTHTPKAGLLGMLAAKWCGVNIRIHTVAGMPLMVEKGFKRTLLTFIEKLTYWAANNIWPNSNSLYNYITEHKLTQPAKLNIIAKGSSNGINLTRFNKASLLQTDSIAVKQQINYAANNTYLLCIGRLVTDKGIAELVKVFTELHSKYNNLRLILAGDFEETLDPLPVETVQQIKNNIAIIHIPWTQQVEYFMDMANYFIFPSHREGFPNVLLQAGAMQLPVICSRITGNVDIVEHEKTGLIFEKADEKQLQQQIEFAISNPEKMKAMAQVLYKKVQQDYSRENIWQHMLAAYNQLLNVNSN